MKPPFPSYTKEWHNAPYDAIAPTNPALSAAGKTAVIIGGSRGIGLSVATAFAQAGAAKVAIVGRTKETLDMAAAKITEQGKNVTVTTHASDIVDENSMLRVANEVGPWDIAVLSAGTATDTVTVENSNISEWWRVYQTNVKGWLTAAHYLLPTRSQNAVMIGVAAGAVCLPPAMFPDCSAYTGSKSTQVRLLECIAAECKNLRVVNVHPGIHKTDLSARYGGHDRGETYPWDDVRLPGHFIVWTASPEARFLHGKTVWANWDVDEMRGRAEKIQSSLDLTSSILGWPFSAE